MSSNLPVLWVPPVTPPDPDERPPKRRGNLGVILAALVIVGLPLGAWATWTRTAGAPADATQQAKVAEVETAAPAKPETPPAKAEPAPSTSGGNLPYIARPTQPAAPAPNAAAQPAPAAPPSPAPAATAEAPVPLGPDGRPVRVIGIDKRSGDMTEPAAAAPPTRVAEPEKPAPAAPPAAAPSPSAAIAPAPVEPAAPRGSIVEAAPPQAPAPQPPVAVAPQPSQPEKPAVAVTEPAAPVAVPPSAAPTVITPPAEASRPATPAPKSAETKPTEPKAKPVPPKREAARTPSRDEDIPRADGGNGDFADRLAAIRRDEARRAVERPRYVPPPEDYEDEEVVVVPRPRWGWQPPVFFDDRPHGPVLRPFERPAREAASRGPVGENCHYHAWPTEDMAFHRQIQCHWHRDPRDSSLRYVR